MIVAVLMLCTSSPFEKVWRCVKSDYMLSAKYAKSAKYIYIYMLDKAGFSIHLDAFQTQHASCNTSCNPPIHQSPASRAPSHGHLWSSPARGFTLDGIPCSSDCGYDMIWPWSVICWDATGKGLGLSPEIVLRQWNSGVPTLVDYERRQRRPENFSAVNPQHKSFM